MSIIETKTMTVYYVVRVHKDGVSYYSGPFHSYATARTEVMENVMYEKNLRVAAGSIELELL